ncbi:hypothetical protein CAPTEDRAFT_200424 [Capitella teleta]|uniref:EF-hand domain-containing protein n=1 Tax=Capitella teleta TaxID=283909 RepID=R7UFW9_CAPTE|nr:hypothetical protein CAPTEDRAFT_200424 [Capitella teleta]|eukprot:ELU04993.1 hypothetical protein CAPTEDRAFT_200424 [Capitella teleta]
MGTLMEEKNSLIGDVFSQFDVKRCGELNADQLQLIHMDMRIGSISISQIEEAIKYVCVNDKCEKSELFDLLQEMDRRYFIIQDLRWLVRAMHGQFFSRLRWRKFLNSRDVPGNPVTFAEIEVMLCNIPSKADYLSDLAEEQREKEEYDRLNQEALKREKEEKERLREQREREQKEQEEEERRKQRDDERRRREEENERAQKQREKDEAEHKRKELDEEEERGRKEAEERERLAKEKADRDKRHLVKPALKQ